MFLNYSRYQSFAHVSAIRSCVGRNLAFLELQIIVASILRRYDIVLENPDEPVRAIFHELQTDT